MRKSKFIAIILAVLFGSFGIHKFYLRNPGQGIMYILLSSGSFRLLGFTIGTLLGIMDAIALMMMDERTFDRKYNWSKVKSGYKPKRKVTPKKPLRKKTTTQFQKKSNPYKRKGVRLLSSYDIREAEEQLIKAREISPKDAEVYWHLACIYSLQEKTRKSFEHLEIALKLGYDRRALQSEDLLAFIRVQPAFERFVKNNYTYIFRNEDDQKPSSVVIKEKIKEKQQKP